MDSCDRVRRSQMLRARKNAITTQHQPRAHRAELMRFASSELLKIETALVRKPSASALCDALAFGFAARLRRFAATSGSLRYSGLASRSCEAAKAGGGERDRTDDLLLAKQALSQLSYTPGTLVGLVGFEPTTPALSRRCSNRLSYRPPTRIEQPRPWE